MKRALALVVLLACKAGPARTFDDEFKDWTPKDSEKLWQGVWVLRLVEDGGLVAVHVEGKRATLFDGKAERHVDFAVTEPCAVRFGTTELQFVVQNGAIRVGRGAVAVVRTTAGAVVGNDRQAIACGDGHDPDAPEEGVYAVRGNRCTTWKRSANGSAGSAWRGRDGVCVWANARGDDLLEVGTEHYLSRLVVKGDFAEEPEFTQSASENHKAASWDDAKAAVVATIKPPSKLDLAKAAGGKVGDLKSIAGLAATYAEHPASLVGEDLEIAGTLVETSTQSVRGKVATTLAVITDASKLTLVCEVAGSVTGIAPNDVVVVKGNIDTRGEDARLKPCTIAKAP